LGKAYELLGVKPGVSLKELKAAHRDLAKVWHPDRFLHDPRLQEKAQEKLKEINEAYDLISSGKVPRPAPPPPSATASVHHRSARESSRGTNWPWAVLVLLVFAAVFAITLRTVRQQRALPLAEETVQAEESSNPDEPQSTRSDSTTRAEVRSAPQESNSENAAPEVAPPATNTESTQTVTSVTVTIDPESGLLAKSECKLRSRMTYPSGSQPTGYCNLSHAPPPKESRLKSIAKTVKRSLD
jgi:hypothetical protein